MNSIGTRFVTGTVVLCSFALPSGLVAGTIRPTTVRSAKKSRSKVAVDAHGHLVRTYVVQHVQPELRVNMPALANINVAAYAQHQASGIAGFPATEQPKPAQWAPPASAAVAQVDGSASLNQIIDATAKQYDVDPLLIHSVIKVESNYNAHAVSPKGAQGVMQLIPATARRFGATNAFDLQQNIEAGVKYLRYLNTLFPNDLRLTLAAYNAGEGAVQKYGNNVPPYAETQNYVELVGSRYEDAKRAAIQSYQPPAPAIPAAVEPAEEKHPRVESYIDAEGRLCLRTETQTEGKAFD